MDTHRDVRQQYRQDVRGKLPKGEAAMAERCRRIQAVENRLAMQENRPPRRVVPSKPGHAPQLIEVKETV